MAESFALARLTILHNRLSMLVVLAWSAAALSITAAASMIFPNADKLPILIICLLPIGVWSFGMFDLRALQDLTDNRGGYSPWLLRMPIATWKLAIVPLALRSVWITAGWCAFAGIAQWTTGTKFPVLTAGMIFAGVGAWVSVMTWRPFFHGWIRIVTIVGSGIVLYGLVALVFWVHFDELPQAWPTMLRVLASFIGLPVYLLGICLAIHSLGLARTHCNGLIPAIENAETVDTRVIPATLPHASAQRALIWHDLRRASVTGRRWSLIFAAVYLAFPVLLLPMSAATVVFVMLVCAHWGIVVASVICEAPKRGQSSLPPYLAASPLTSAQIAYTRLTEGVLLSIAGLALSLILASCWLLWPESRISFANWVESISDVYGSPMAAPRFLTAFILYACIFAVGRGISYLWPTMTGSTKVQTGLLVIPAGSFLAAIALVCAWFVMQKDLESAKANAWYWASWLPLLAGILVGIKAFLSVVAMRRSLAHRLITVPTVAGIVSGWLVGTLAFSVILFVLIPDARVHFSWCLLASALTVPLARVLSLPYAVFCNRHW